MADDGGWKKWLVYLGIGAGVVGAGYLFLSNFLVNPVSVYEKMFKDQYAALVKKMQTYTSTNPDGWTPSQQQNVSQENSILSQTAAGLAASSQGVIDLSIAIVAGATAIGISAVIARAALRRFGDRTGGTVRTGQGAYTVTVSYLADTLAQQGYLIEATNLLATARQTFEVYDLPYMQQTVNALTESLPLLSGIDLIVTQQLIEAFTVEMAVIPVILALPPLI